MQTICSRIRIFNACVKSVLLYGFETWLVTKEIQRKIQTFVNRFLRYILRIWWPNIISNEDLWKVTGQEDINAEIRKRKFGWIGHTLRKEDGEIPKAALLWNPQGNRKRGRPRNSWIRSVIKEAGRSWNELSFLAADRQKWEGLIDNLCYYYVFSFDVWSWSRHYNRKGTTHSSESVIIMDFLALKSLNMAGNRYLEEMHGDVSNLCEGHRKKIHVCFDLDVTKGRSV